MEHRFEFEILIKDKVTQNKVFINLLVIVYSFIYSLVFHLCVVSYFHYYYYIVVAAANIFVVVVL